MFLVEAFTQSGVFAKLSLLVGFAPPLAAILYIVRPSEATLAFLRPISLASIFAGICGLTAGLIAVLMGVAATGGQVAIGAVYAGLAEALVPSFFNFGLLSVSWLLIAIGMWRRTP